MYIFDFRSSALSHNHIRQSHNFRSEKRFYILLFILHLKNFIYLTGNMIMRKYFTIIIFLMFCHQAFSQWYGFYSIETRFNGEDAWKEWTVKYEGNYFTLQTMFSGDDAWKHWKTDLLYSIGDIQTVYSGKDAWQRWQFDIAGTKGNIYTVYSDKNAWKDWQIYSGGTTLRATTVYSSGDDAWREWNISGPEGYMRVYTLYSCDNGWTEWRIEDDMLNEKPQIKMAAIFPCIVSSFLLNNLNLISNKK